MPDTGLAPPSAREPTPRALLDELWAEVKRIDPAAAALTPPQLPTTQPPATQPPAMQPPGAHPGPPDLAAADARAAHLPDLLAMDEAAFIPAAYLAVLGRPVDPTGYAALEAALAAGAPKTTILHLLRTSAEGRLARRDIPGLGSRALLERLATVRGLGWLVRRAAGLLRRTGLARPLLAWEARLHRVPRALLDTQARLDQLARTQEVLARSIAELNGGLSRKVDRVDDRVDRATAAIHRVAEEAHARDDALHAAIARMRSAVTGRSGPAQAGDAAARLPAPDLALLVELVRAGAGSRARPILDLHAGDGAWLAMLGGAGLQAAGVVSDTALAAPLLARGLDVTIADPAVHLVVVPAGTLGAVTGFGVLGPRAVPDRVRLLDGALRALAPGGLAIFDQPADTPRLAAMAKARGYAEVALRDGLLLARRG